MKKAIAIVVLGMLFFTSFSMISIAEKLDTSDQIILSYSFEKPIIEKIKIRDNIYDRVTMKDSPCYGNPGEPQLPGKGAYILIPQGRKISEIIVTYDEIEYLGSGFMVEPGAECVPFSKISTAPMPKPDVEIYSSSDMFPGKFFTEVGTYSFRGYEILVLRLNPVQYVPVTGELFYYHDLSVSIETIEDGDVNPLFRGLEKDKLEVVKKVDNPSIVNTYECQSMKTPGVGASGESYDMVIITKNLWKDGFESLKEAHDADGLSTFIYAVEDIYNEYSGVDNAERIRNFIKFAYDSYGIEYVLIGGDHNIIPGRILYWDRPSDLYYSCLDGSYNSNGNEYWGEHIDGEGGGDVDLIAEVYVGRVCVENKEEINNFIQKTLSYLFINPTKTYLDNTLLVGEFVGFGGVADWGGNFIDELVDGCSEHGYVTVGIPSEEFSIDRLYDRDWENHDWPKSELINRLNEGFHIINHIGHGDIKSAMKMEKSDFLTLNNDDKNFFIYSQACYTGRFTSDDCVAEYLTVKTSSGAFAVIMNSRKGWGSSMDTNSPAQCFNREFWDAVFGENIRVISKANQDSKVDNIWRLDDQEWGSRMRDTYYQLNLFGDPSIELTEYCEDEIAPEKPTINGPTSGITQTEHTYTAVTSDPDGDDVSYFFYWGDSGSSGWTEFMPSGTPVSRSHSWDSSGTYHVKVKAKNSEGVYSDWTELIVTMPRNRKTNNLFSNFFQNYQNLFPFLRQIIRLFD